MYYVFVLLVCVVRIQATGGSSLPIIMWVPELEPHLLGLAASPSTH